MPSRLVCVAILVYWVISALGLITRDLLPELTIGSPPDLRSIARAEVNSTARWVVEVVDDPAAPENSLRSVGEALTVSILKPDGETEMSSKVWFNSAGLLRGTPFETRSDVNLEISSNFMIDPSGNLKSLRAGVKAAGDLDELLTIDGRMKDHVLEVTARGPFPIMNRTRRFPYEPRSVVQNALGPMDRLPGLHVGQRWETRVVSPLSGRVEAVRVEVTRRTVIHWDRSLVATLEVVQRMGPLSAKTWVRPDGVVLRQEVPFPFVKLILERQSDPVARNSKVPTR